MAKKLRIPKLSKKEFEEKWQNIPDKKSKAELKDIIAFKEEVKRLMFCIATPLDTREVVHYMCNLGFPERKAYLYAREVRVATLKYTNPKDIDNIRDSFYQRYQNLYEEALLNSDKSAHYLKLAGEFLNQLKEFFPQLIAKQDSEKTINVNFIKEDK